MRSTILHRPHTDEETLGLIAETLYALIDARTDSMVRGALERWGWVDSATNPYDATETRKALRFILPHEGFGESTFRVRYGWTTDELAQIIMLLRLSAESMRGAAAFAMKTENEMLSGTAETLMRDADKIDRLVERWSVGVVLPGGKALQPEVTHRIKLNGGEP